MDDVDMFTTRCEHHLIITMMVDDSDCNYGVRDMPFESDSHSKS